MFVVGTKVICTVSIVAFHFFQKVNMPGTVKNSNSQKVLVELEDTADSKKYKWEFERTQLVDKNNCVALK